MSDPIIAYLKSIDDTVKGLDKKFDEKHVAIDKRVRSLENTRSEARGAAKLAILLSSTVSAGISYLIATIKNG